MSRLDYRAIRERISIRQVLELIAFKPVHRRGDQWRGPCPICGDPAEAKSRYFSANIKRHLFRCFRCHRSGNPLDLWTELSGLPIYESTLDLCNRLKIQPIPLQNPQSTNRR